jgi:alpha-maltose-1-phosphate synthase
MRLCYILLSPTWGMHQYTADLANRMAAAGHSVHVVTCRRAPRDRYGPDVVLHTPVDTRDRGFSGGGLLSAPMVLRQSLMAVTQVRPDVVHFTGPHLVNPLLLRALSRQGIPTVHTLHDVHPHAGSGYGRLLYLWNRWVRREADHLLVHGRRYQEELISLGVDSGRLTCTLLTHLFVGYDRERMLELSSADASYERFALFIGRLEAYKGLDVLVEAAGRLDGLGASVVIAGPGQLGKWVSGPLPGNVDVRPGLAADDEAVELFRRCGLVVLPYLEASQSALVAAAYFFGKPVVVSRVGALPEYVIEGETGWAVPPGDSQALAAVLADALADRGRLAEMGRAGRAWYSRARQAEGEALGALYLQLKSRSRV